jgi:hypothetical protein
VAEEIASRIYNAEDGAWTHPLLIVGILAELERERHMKLVQERVFALLTRVRALSRGEAVSVSSEMVRENYSVDLWIDVSQLRIALGAWLAELRKVVGCVKELEGLLEEEEGGWGEKGGLKLEEMEKGYGEDEKGGKGYKWKKSVRKTGRRIQKRLGEIMAEYELKIKECSMVLDGMALSAQLVGTLHVAPENEE